MIGRRTDGKIVRRPLSPHLQAYDMMQMTSVTSVLHRATGCAWAAGTLLLAWWLMAAATGEVAFARVQWFMSSFLGILILFGLTASAWYHTLAGLRHLVWDAGFGFEIPTVYKTGRAVLIGTGVLTVLTWLLAIAFWG